MKDKIVYENEGRPRKLPKEKFLCLVHEFYNREGRKLSHSELAEKLDLGKSTFYRYITEATKEEWENATKIDKHELSQQTITVNKELLNWVEVKVKEIESLSHAVEKALFELKKQYEEKES